MSVTDRWKYEPENSTYNEVEQANRLDKQACVVDKHAISVYVRPIHHVHVTRM